MRFFNTSGPVVADDHYCIPPLDRLNLSAVRRFVREKRYFVLHAPRQTGKTSVLLTLRDLLNAEGDYRCVYVNVEGGQAGREDAQQVVRTLLGTLALRASATLDDEFLLEVWSGILAEFGPHTALQVALTRWAEANPKPPLVLLIDEIDALLGDALLSVLRQLRAGYDLRPAGFPQSVVLCGVRDVRDLGLVAQSRPLRLANPIYAEVVPRELTWVVQEEFEQETAWYVDDEGHLEVDKLLTAFQAFFRVHSEHWVERFAYKEAGPQLLLQAFLQRIVNRGGRIEREYGLGRMRTDLLILWPQGEQTRKVVVECKMLHKSLEQTLAEGVEQTAEYMDRCGATAGHLVVFDRGKGRRWADKVFHDRRVADSGMEIDVWGM